MQVVVSGQHLEITPALREHATARARKACEHLAEAPGRCSVILNSESHRSSAEMVVHYHGRDFAAHGTSDADMYQAIDAAGTRLRRQLDDFSGKESAHR